jgi:hypothetical protein
MRCETMSPSPETVSAGRLLCSIVFAAFVALIAQSGSAASRETAVAVKKCSHGGIYCDHTLPAVPCTSGMAPSNHCLCYTDFTIVFAQTVDLTAEMLDTDCGGPKSGHFVLYNTGGTIVTDISMGNPIGSWVGTTQLSPGTYRINSSDMWGGRYSVTYWPGSPDCSGGLSIANPDFGTVKSGDTTPWRDANLTNNGNSPFSNISVVSTDPVYELQTGSIPAILQPGGVYTFKVRFHAPAGLTSDQTYDKYINVTYTCNSGSLTRQMALHAIAHVPRGKLDVSSQLALGSADWTSSPQGAQINKYLRIYNRGDAPMTVNATLTDNGGGAFTLPNGGAVGSISGNNYYKDLLVQSTVTAEQTYSGELSVSADYGSGLGDIRLVSLTARGHHPKPILSLLSTDIDFREVEVGYRFRQAIWVTNSGDAPLYFNLNYQNSADPAKDQFNVNPDSFGPLAGGDSLALEVSFTPQIETAATINLLIDNTNEQPPVSRTVTLRGTGTAPKKMSTVLVVDRTGSMSAAAGTVKKIVAARDAGSLLTELLQPAWDWFALTKYNTASSTPIPLGDIAGNRTTSQTKLAEIGPGGEFEPIGATSIGLGMQTGALEFAQSTPDRDQTMILLTDGKENAAPYINEVKLAIKAANPSLHIYCVGIGNPVETGPYGNDGVQTAKLNEIADETDGMFRLIQSLAGKSLYDLEAFYFKVFARSHGNQVILDPIYDVPLATSLQYVTNVPIATCDRQADFLIMSELLLSSVLEKLIVLEDPTGQMIVPTSTVGGVSVQIKTWGHCRLYRIKFPDRGHSAAYAGMWKVYLKPIDSSMINRDRELSHLPTKTGTIGIGFLAAVGSDYRMTGSVTPGEVLVGQRIHVSATTTEAWWPMPNAIASVHVKLPNGSVVQNQLFDDGLHGDGSAKDSTFGLDFMQTSQEGYYEFLIHGEGLTERNERVIREINLGKFVGVHPPDSRESPCIPCWLIRLVFTVIILLLLLILAYLIYCCRRRLMVKG